jgi:hypothetical protein
MLTEIKTSQAFKNILMEYASNPQFAVFHLRVYDLRVREDLDLIGGEFIGWWYGNIDFGETKNDCFDIEMYYLTKPGGMSVHDYEGVDSSDFEFGYISNNPGSEYWQAEGNTVIAVFNNSNWCDEGEKPTRTLRLEITPLAVLK